MTIKQIDIIGKSVSIAIIMSLPLAYFVHPLLLLIIPIAIIVFIIAAILR